mmetsp:Transcript_15570/g.33004  ORF Transcript_15570/g.33004 Transcript_15570/m.33004 type:complete len:310 (-) Transcript_15570:390-1319(-)
MPPPSSWAKQPRLQVLLLATALGLPGLAALAPLLGLPTTLPLALLQAFGLPGPAAASPLGPPSLQPRDEVGLCPRPLEPLQGLARPEPPGPETLVVLAVVGSPPPASAAWTTSMKRPALAVGLMQLSPPPAPPTPALEGWEPSTPGRLVADLAALPAPTLGLLPALGLLRRRLGLLHHRLGLLPERRPELEDVLEHPLPAPASAWRDAVSAEPKDTRRADGGPVVGVPEPRRSRLLWCSSGWCSGEGSKCRSESTSKQEARNSMSSTSRASLSKNLTELTSLGSSKTPMRATAETPLRSWLCTASMIST